MENYIITIARGFGSGGKFIGTQLAKELNIPCYDNQLPSMLEEYSGINKAKFANVDEKLSSSYLIKKLSEINSRYVASPMEKDFVSDNNLYNIQSELITDLYYKQSCVIIGKCANHILKKMKNVVSIYIEAPRADCVASIMPLMGLTEKEAHNLIEKTDKYRADYYKYYTNGLDWTDPIAYHMTLNTGKVKREDCVKIIINYLKIRGLIQN